MMKKFRGLPSDKTRSTAIPDAFFTELLSTIDNLAELKTVLYAFWYIDQLEGAFRYIERADFARDKKFMQGLNPDKQIAAVCLDASLARAVERGVLLSASLYLDGNERVFYVVNNPRSEAAIKAIQNGNWKPSGNPKHPIELSMASPNIFHLYEENIGPITPLIRDALLEAEGQYSAYWIEEAIEIATTNNARSWNYINAILERWYKEGKDERQVQRDSEKDRRKYIEGDYADFIEH